jgi:hypothetical protein
MKFNIMTSFNENEIVQILSKLLDKNCLKNSKTSQKILKKYNLL